MRCLLLTTIMLLTFVVAASGATDPNDIPLGQSQTADELFDTQRGYINPSFGVTQTFTDNLFNTRDSRENELITTLTPAIWLSFPGGLQPSQKTVTETTAAGGVSLGTFGEDDERPFNAYLSYEADIRRLQKFNSENLTNHYLQSLLRWTTTGGLIFELQDVYTRSFEGYAVGVSQVKNDYDSNLVSLQVETPVADERFGLRLKLSNYFVDFADAANSFLDRSDNKLSAFVFYSWSQKSEFFTEYSFLDINYDSSTVSDSQQQLIYLGIEYHATQKMQLLAKFGLNNRESSSGLSDRELFEYELQLDHQFTEKNNLNLQVWRKLKEGGFAGNSGVLNSEINATFSQMLGRKTVVTARAGLSRDEYDGLITLGSQTAELVDDYLELGLSLGYVMKKWFEVNCGYSYVDRESNFSSLDYSSNQVFLSLTGTF